MEINKDKLIHIMRESKCEWTRGYLACLIDDDVVTDDEIVRDIINGANSKIDAIKKIKANYGLGLREAKDVVDEHERSGAILMPKT
jgi:hypothetical protein